jgi:hypothetical protein
VKKNDNIPIFSNFFLIKPSFTIQGTISSIHDPLKLFQLSSKFLFQNGHQSDLPKKKIFVVFFSIFLKKLSIFFHFHNFFYDFFLFFIH